VPHSHGISTTALVLIVLAAVAAALLLFGLFLLGRKRVRVRRRRRLGDPRRRLLGAWQESLDVLEESGLPDLSHLTSAEVATVTGERFGAQPAAQARYIGDAANVAIFSPTSWVGPAEADAAWRAQVVLSKAVRRRLGWRDRLGASVRYHRSRRATAAAGPSSWMAAAEARRQAAMNRGRHASGQRRRRRERSKAS
jgi:AraC-like DNA-binding protein